MNPIPDRIKAFVSKMENDAEISSVCKPGYEFAHIVLDDWNFQDSSIELCLGESDKWFIEKLWQLGADDPKEEKLWQRWQYDAVCTYKRKLEELLEWMLTVPEKIREEAELLMYDDVPF